MSLWKLLLKALVSFILLYFLFSKVFLNEVLSYLRSAALFPLALAVILEVFAVALDTWKWIVLLKKQGTYLTFPQLFRVRLIGQFFNNFLPSNLGGDVVRIYYLSSMITNRSRSIASVVASRVFGILALGPLIFLSLFLIPTTTPHVEVIRGALVLFLMSMGAGVTIVFCPRLITKVFSWFPRWLPQAVEMKLTRFFKEISCMMTNKESFFPAFLTSMGFHLLGIASVFYIAKALGTAVAFFQLMWIVPTVGVLLMMPISINGLGLQDISLVFLLGLSGIEAPLGLAISLFIHLIRLLISCMGGGLWFMGAIPRMGKGEA